MQATFTLEDYINNPNCTAAGTPEMFGYKSFIHTNTFSIKFDTRSLITCIALNSHVTSPMAMQVIDSDIYIYKNSTYLVEVYVDSRYPGMKPVRCIYPRGRSNDPYCMLTLGNVYALPVFNHAGNSFDHPSPCNCSLEIATTDIATNPYNLCKFLLYGLYILLPILLRYYTTTIITTTTLLLLLQLLLFTDTLINTSLCTIHCIYLLLPPPLQLTLFSTLLPLLLPLSLTLSLSHYYYRQCLQLPNRVHLLPCAIHP